VLTIVRGWPSTQDWVNLTASNIFVFLFDQGHRKKEDPTAIMSLIMFDNGFDPASFIIKANTEGYQQMTWTTDEERKMFTITMVVVQKGLR